MFRQMQIKLIVFYTSIVALILIVTNLSVYFLLSTYNNYQLARETESMLNSIQSTEWIKEDQGSIDDVIVKELPEEEQEREAETKESEGESDDVESKEAPRDEDESDGAEEPEDEEHIDEDKALEDQGDEVEKLEEDTVNKVEDHKEENKSEEIDEPEEENKGEEIDEPGEENKSEDLEEPEEENKSEDLEKPEEEDTTIASSLKSYASVEALVRSHQVSRPLAIKKLSTTTVEQSDLNKGDKREVYFPSSNELYIPEIFEAFTYYYIYAEDGTLLRWKGPNEEEGSLLLAKANALTLNNTPEVVHIKTPVEAYYLVVKMPIDIEGVTYGYYIAVRDVSIAYETVDNLAKIIAISLVVGILASILLGYIISGRIMKPIEEAYTSKQKFLADASHELRTPISIVLLSCDAMVQETDQEQLEEMIQDVKEEALQMRELVENLLNLARHDSGRIVMQHEQLEIGALVQATVKQYRFLAEEKAIELSSHSDEGLVIKGDRKLIHSAISIIIDNAIKYSSEEGQVFVKTEASMIGRKSYVEVSVRDTGRGMDEDELQKVFQRFYRVDQARAKKEVGHGLGLSIAKEVVDLHKGTISVESTLGEGSKFTLGFRS